jgi:hypothetical protein
MADEYSWIDLAAFEDIDMIRASKPPPPIIMEEVTDPEELAKARALDERFDRNVAWLQAHAADIYDRYRGKCICIAGEELFVADTPEEVLAQAKAAHPEDNGFFIRYIPREKMARIYAN